MRTLLAAVALALAPAAVAQPLQTGAALPLASQSFATADGQTLTLGGAAKSAGTMVVFWANRCAWADRNAERLTNLVTTFGDRFGVVVVSSTPLAAAPGGVPVVVDGTGALVRAFGVQRAPQAFVFNASGTLAYTGAFDDSPADAAAARKHYAADALTAVAAGQTPAVATSEAFGCIVRPPAGQ
ncbi:MAG: redoxin family protein [Bacteroidetes bacterium]|nr:redoxin family protein [Bacteroidota bacterium]